MGSRNLWVKILPLQIGTKIKTIKDTCKEQRQAPIPLGSRGVVAYYVNNHWKAHMIHYKYYPRSILRETMYAVSFPETGIEGEVAFRWFELEAY